jgi:hypothetical protein
MQQQQIVDGRDKVPVDPVHISLLTFIVRPTSRLAAD